MSKRVVKYTDVGGVELCRHRDRIAMFVENIHGERKEFEPETRAVFEGLVDSELAVIDVGASTGLYSILAVQCGAMEVFAIEPNPKAVKRLRHNLRHNGAQEEVEIVEGAASAFVGQGKLEIGGTEARGISTTSKLVEGTGTGVTTLDVLVDAMCFSEVGLIKIDVEGHELAVLTGAQELLENEHPALIVEVNSRSGGDREAEIAAYLELHGYEPRGKLLDGRNRFYHWTGRES